jgi:hypothetical protein
MENVTIPQHSVIQYIRSKNNLPSGVLVAIKSENGFRIGYSLCNKKDRFNKSMALKIAMGRAEFGMTYPTTSTPHPVRKMFPAFLDRCKKYYKVTQ